MTASMPRTPRRVLRRRSTSFRREIHLEGDLTEDERAKLMEIADKCPVHRTLERSSTVETVLAAG